MKYSIIIPTRRRADLLYRTLASLANQAVSGIEVIVVCDGEDEQTRLLAETYKAKFPLFWIFNEQNCGAASARNTGARAARGKVLIFLDDDTSAAPDWVSHHRKHHESRTSDGYTAVCGKIVNSYSQNAESNTERFLREETEKTFEAFQNASRAARNSHKYRCFGVNCSIARDVFLNFHGFDPHLTIEEDMEFGSRLFDGGVNFVTESNAIVHHRDTKSLRSYLTQCWNASGHIHLYRAFSKQQRNAQTQGLAAVGRRRSLRKLKAWVCFSYPDQVHKLASLSQQAAETTNSRFLFQIWMKLSMSASYWGGIRSEGFTWSSLRNVVGSPLPVFSLHSICVPRQRKERRYYFSPRRFQNFLKMLKAHGYRSVTPEQGLFEQVSSNRFVLTFDDGYDDFYTEVFPHVSTFALKPIVFLVMGQIGKSNAWDARLNYKSPRKLLSAPQVREMHRHGVLFGSHTLSHPSLPTLSDSELCKEVQESKSRLEDLLGSEVTYFAYPYGALDLRVRAAVAQAGYKFGFSVEHGSNLWQDPLALRRMELSDRDTGFGVLWKLATDRSLENDILLPLEARLRRAARRFSPRLVRATRELRQKVFAS